MNEMQFYIAVAVGPVATMAIVMVGVMLNNARLNDVKELLRAEIKVLAVEMQKNQSELLHRFAELDTRLARVEAKK